MKICLNFMVLIAITAILLSCNKKQAAPDPTCPTCWDEKMECVDLACQCPEGSIETWLNLFKNSEKDNVFGKSRKYCIKPNKLTFMAHFPRFECIDTFAITFLTEPLEVSDQTPVLATSQVKPEVPKSFTALPPGLTIDPNDPNGTYVAIPSLYPTHGTSIFGCLDLDLDGSIDGGIGRLSFRGNFTHKDTISGAILFEGAWGSKEHRDNYELKGIKLIRTVPY
jgi:hypothetical protein